MRVVCEVSRLILKEVDIEVVECVGGLRWMLRVVCGGLR